METKKKDKYSIAERFSEFIALPGNFTTLPLFSLQNMDYLDLDWDEAMFIAMVLSYKWTAKLPYPSLRKMAKQSKKAESTLHEIKKSLIKKGYLIIVKRTEVKGRSTKQRLSNKYDFSGLFKAIEDVKTGKRIIVDEKEIVDEDKGQDPDEWD